MSNIRPRTPQTDYNRVIFPLNWKSMSYETSDFTSSQVESRCGISDIEQVIKDIDTSTNKLRPIALTKKIMLGCIFVIMACVFIGIIITILTGDANSYSRHCYGTSCRTTTGVNDDGWVVLFVLVPAILVLVLASCRKRQQWNLLRVRIVEVFNSHKGQFSGLRWEAPNVPDWIELWNDFRQGMTPPQNDYPTNYQPQQQQYMNTGMQPLNQPMSYDNTANTSYANQQYYSQGFLNNYPNSNNNYGQPQPIMPNMNTNANYGEGPLVNTQANYGGGPQGYNTTGAL